MKNNLTSLSIFCLAISIVIGSWLISDSLKLKTTNQIQSSKTTNQFQSSKTYNALLTQKELASYLGISENDAKKLGPVKDEYTGDTTSVFPYIKLGNKIYYSKLNVDKVLTNMDLGTYSSD